MKTFLKFIGWAVAAVMGITFANFWFSWAAELITTKNSFAVAGGLMMIGVGLGALGWVGLTLIKKTACAFFKWDPSKEESCCQNDCGCDRSSR